MTTWLSEPAIAMEGRITAYLYSALTSYGVAVKLVSGPGWREPGIWPSALIPPLRHLPRELLKPQFQQLQLTTEPLCSTVLTPPDVKPSPPPLITFKDFFDVGPFLKGFIEFDTILLPLRVLVFWLGGMGSFAPQPGMEPTPLWIER